MLAPVMSTGCLKLLALLLYVDSDGGQVARDDHSRGPVMPLGYLE